MNTDAGTPLIQACLQANGFFTVVDYPLIEQDGDHPGRNVTDVDVLAVRFPMEEQESSVGRRKSVRGPVARKPDPALAWLSLLHKCQLSLQKDASL